MLKRYFDRQNVISMRYFSPVLLSNGKFFQEKRKRTFFSKKVFPRRLFQMKALTLSIRFKCGDRL